MAAFNDIEFVGLTPEGRSSCLDTENVGDGLPLNIPRDSPRTSAWSESSPMGRYLADFQHHEWLAVSLYMGASDECRLRNAPVFTRSLAPGVPNHWGVDVGVVAKDRGSTSPPVDLADHNQDQPSFLPDRRSPEPPGDARKPDGLRRRTRHTSPRSMEVNTRTSSGSPTSPVVVEAISAGPRSYVQRDGITGEYSDNVI